MYAQLTGSFENVVGSTPRPTIKANSKVQDKYMAPFKPICLLVIVLRMSRSGHWEGACGMVLIEMCSVAVDCREDGYVRRFAHALVCSRAVLALSVAFFHVNNKHGLAPVRESFRRLFFLCGTNRVDSFWFPERKCFSRSQTLWFPDVNLDLQVQLSAFSSRCRYLQGTWLCV